MPLPLLAWAAIVAAGALVAGVGVWAFSGAKGKSVVLLGERKSGKTTFFTYLNHGVIPEGYTPTNEPQAIRGKIDFGGYKLEVRSTDLSGAKIEWSNWREQSSGADLVCFMASWEHIADPVAIVRVKRSAKQVGSWQLSAKILLVISFLDAAEKTADEVILDPRVRNLKQLLNASAVAAVDQTDELSRHDLGYSTLRLLDS